MSHVITQSCCNDASCVDVCPVDCIHPGPTEPGFAGAEMLYIDPGACIDCGACIDVCPVGAIVPDHALSDENEVYREVNAAFFAGSGTPGTPPRAQPVEADQEARGGSPAVTRDRPGTRLRVAVVGSGPAACYAAEHLLGDPALDVEVSMFERLPTPGGLVRYGVAPDHQATKAISQLFARTIRRTGLRLFLNCEVGEHLGPEELLQHHHAVIVAAGAAEDRRLDVPGEDLPGSHAARELVSWYNGHPDSAGRTFDLSAERVVVVGNGNVALDVARVLMMGPDDLHRSDVPAHVVDALAESRVREVVVLGRRGPADAAFTGPELHALGRLPGVDVAVRGAGTLGPAPSWKARLVHELAGRPGTPGRRRITLRFHGSPAAVLGSDRVEGLRVVRTEVRRTPDGGAVVVPTDDVEDLPCGLVLRSVGYRGTPLAGLPFDEARGVLPHHRGRVLGSPGAEDALPGLYVTGWIKRGPGGVIGTNRACAAQTVASLVADFRAGRLDDPAHGATELLDLLDHRRPHWVDARGWSAIDRHEQLTGRAAGRPRAKLVETGELLRVAGPRAVRA